jgi:hypothetical protein
MMSAWPLQSTSCRRQDPRTRRSSKTSWESVNVFAIESFPFMLLSKGSCVSHHCIVYLHWQRKAPWPSASSLLISGHYYYYRPLFETETISPISQGEATCDSDQRSDGFGHRDHKKVFASEPVHALVRTRLSCCCRNMAWSVVAGARRATA